MSHTLLESKNRRAGKGMLGAVLGVGVLAVAGFAAYKILFDRPGEAAAAYLPADSALVVTIDLTPSDRQLDTFNKITQALSDQGIDVKLDGFLKSAFDKDPVGADIRPHLKRNAAIGIWPSQAEKGQAVCLWAVDDPAAVTTALDRHTKADGNGVYKLKSPPGTCVAVLDEYLVISDSADLIARVRSVHADKGSSVSSLPAFVEARSSLPKDANVMVFMSAKFMKDMAGTFGASPLKGTDWMAYSATVEPDGLALDYHCPFDPKALPAMGALASTAPFSLDTLRELPQGAYGLMGVSQAGQYWSMFDESVKAQGADMQSELRKGIREFEGQSGISIAKDVVPALQGEQVIACYPGPTGQGSDIDLVLMATNGNGAPVAALADKVRAAIERESAKHDQPVRFKESKIGDVTVWEIDAKARDEMVRGIYGGFAAPQRNAPIMDPTYGMDGNPSNPGAFQGSPTDRPGFEPPKAADPAKTYKDKTILYAVFQDKLVISSSRGLVSQMIAVSQGGKSLADSPAFASMKTRVIDGSQSVCMVDVKRIMDAMRPMIEQGLEGAPVKADDILNLFGDGTSGMVGSGVYDGKVTKGRFFMPLDWERLIKLIGGGMKSMEGGPNMGGMPDMGAQPPMLAK